MLKFGGLALFCCLLQLTSFAQEINVTSGFIKDSVQIGEPISYYLTARYPSSVMALFPDSTFKFSPFEYEGKAFFPTKTTEGISYDSAVYKLSTFEIDLVQYLSLPVFVTTARDCTMFESARDSIRLIEQIKIPASDTTAINQLTLKSNTLYERVFTEFNTIILLIVVSVLVIGAIVSWVFFGKKIIRYFKIRKLEKKHQKFATDFATQIQTVSTSFTREKTEFAVSTWKKYLEQLERKPYTKLTTREVISMEADAGMGTSLKQIDNAIYGHQTSVIDPLESLKKIAEERFTKKIEQLKHE